MNKEIYIITNVQFDPSAIVDKVYSKMKNPRVFNYNGRKVWRGEDSKSIILPRGTTLLQAEEIGETLSAHDFIHSFLVVEMTPWGVGHI